MQNCAPCYVQLKQFLAIEANTHMQQHLISQEFQVVMSRLWGAEM